MALTIEQITDKVDALKERFSSRDQRMSEITAVRRGDMALLYRAPSNASVVLKRELTRIAEARGARLDIVTGSHC